MYLREGAADGSAQGASARLRGVERCLIISRVPERTQSCRRAAAGAPFSSVGFAAVGNPTGLEQQQTERRSACHQDVSQRLFV